MGRLFVTVFEGPFVYKCKHCQTDLGVRSDIVSAQDLGTDGKLYAFTKLFNVFLVASTFPYMSDVLCVYCSARLGSYYVSAVESISSTYRVLRRKLHGPEGSDDEV
ncbi:hypothetical protein N665_0185s0055 [Sinapis alba]|nr:hypothetical protein N665_0185s0055 [Sinapis alba]